MADLVINVDLDKKCKRCRKPGATQGGYCLGCLGKMVSEGKFDHILKRRSK
jgi:hypothetical protein